MQSPPVIDEDLIRRLPLPLAQLYRRAHNAKTLLERHLTAFYLWEAGLKLLASTAIVEYAQQGLADPQLAERLQNLARPALGHWWELLRRLVPTLADHGHEPFQKVRDLLLGRTRDDCPRAAGLDAVLREALGGKSGAQATVRFTELFDRMVQYRNQVLAHAAPGQLKDDFNDRMGRAILAAVAEIFSRLDMLAGRRLIYVAEVRQVTGAWLVERHEMIGESARRIASLELRRDLAPRLPDAERLYVDDPARPADENSAADPLAGLRSLHPLVIYDADAEEVLFLNARRGRQRTEYLCYTTGRTLDRTDLGGERRELLARVLGMDIDANQMELWEARSQAEEPMDQEAGVRGPEAGRRTLGEFELLSELGRGGMGVVYRAWQPSLSRQVALKKLLHTGDAKAEARFRREIRALGGVEHPHVVKVYTSGSEGTDWFYAMELVEGATLAGVCQHLQGRTPSAAAIDEKTWQEALSTSWEEACKKEKPIGAFVPEPRKSTQPVDPPVAPALGSGGYVRSVVELIRQAAEAAHALHATGVIHRDIKPGNIVVKSDGSQAILMDLGLAQLADEMEGKLTRTRQFVGTLRYASPEQVLAVDRLDCRSDVYSLGATLWELLTLRPMFGATEETPTPKLMKSIEFDEPERISKHHPGIAADLEAVVMKCLEKDPAHRYPSAKELAEDLGRWLRNEPVHAQAPTRGYRIRKYVRRNRERLSVATLLVLLLMVIVGMGYHLFRKVEVVTNEPTTPAHKIPIGSAPKDESARARPSDIPKPPEEVPVGKRRALLVGCANYPKVRGKFHNLKGPGNDVALVHKLLSKKFHFMEEDIRILVEDKPTRQNIAREIQAMGDAAEPGAQFIIYLSGNGGQQPIEARAAQDKKSPVSGMEIGVENIFLPIDAGAWEQGKRIQDSIAGREFAGWVKPIVKKGASLWVICDACNGGFGSGAEWDESSSGDNMEQGGIVFLYASRPGESTVETLLPRDSPNAETYGLFSYYLVQVLTQATSPITYAELARRINAKYMAEGRTFPRAWAAGNDRGKPILDSKKWSEREPLLVMPDRRGGFMVNAGSLQGLTPGMIFAVSPATVETFSGYVRITKVSDIAGTARPCAYSNAPLNENLPVAGRCAPVYVEYADLWLKLVLDGRCKTGDKLTDSRRADLSEQLEKAIKDANLPVQLVTDPSEAQWVVRVESLASDSIYFLPNRGDSARLHRGLEMTGLADTELQAVELGPFPIGKLSDALSKDFARVARGQNLLALAEKVSTDQSWIALSPEVEIQLIRYRAEADQVGQVVVENRGRVTLPQDDLISFRVSNLGSAPLDVTMLHVDGRDNSMQVVFPRGAGSADNRLPPGKTLITPRQQVKTVVNHLEQILLIATEAKEPPVTFGFLTQPSLSAARKVIDATLTERTIDSSFGRLLQNALYANDAVKGIEVKTLERLAFRRLSWQTISRAEGAISLGRHLFHAENGEWEQAESEYREAVANTSGLQILLDTSVLMDSEGIQWTEVLNDFSSLINGGRDEWWVWRGRGLASAGLKHWEQAAADFKKAAERKPDDWESWRALALCQCYAHRFDQAVAACNKAIELRRQSWESWYLRGFVHHKRKGENKQAQLDCSIAIELAQAAVARAAVASKPDRHGYLEILGAMLFRAGRYEEAIKRLSEAAVQHGGGGTVWTQLFLAMAHYRLGEMVAAPRVVGLMAATTVGQMGAPGGFGALLALPPLPGDLEARQWLDLAKKQIQAKMNSGGGNPIHWGHLLDEAEWVMKQGTWR